MPSLLDDYDGGNDIDLSEVPGFESLYNEQSETTDDSNTLGGAAENEKPRTEMETLQSQNAELMQILRAQNERPPAPIYVNAPPPQQQQRVDPSLIRAQVEAEYYKDPVGTSQKMAQFAAEQRFGGDMNMIRETLTQQAVAGYKQNLMGDPQFANAASKYFDEQIARVPPGSLSRLNPQQLQEFLGFAEESAWGRVMKQVRSNQKKTGNSNSGNSRQNPPAYGGTGRGGSGGNSSGRGNQNRGNTEEQLSRALGLTQSDFDDIIE